MSRCSRTDELLGATFGDAGLSSADADHAAACPDCARALADARRFDRALHVVGAELAPEPIPPGTATATDGAAIREGTPIGRRLAVIGGLSAAIVVGVLAGTAEWGAADSSHAAQLATTDAKTDAWVQSALELVSRAEPDGGEAAGWKPVRVERCGHTGLAFFQATATDGLPVHRWTMGSIDVHPPQVSGTVRSVDDASVARVRATLPPCETVVDAVAAPLLEVGGPRELWTLTTGDEDVEGEVRVIGATTVSDGHRVGPPGDGEVLTYLVLLERRSGGGALVERASISVMDGWTTTSRFLDVPVARPEAANPLQVFADPGYLDETLFAWIDDPRVRAVDIWVPRESKVLRYTVASPGFVVQFDARVGPVDELTYEMLDEHGAVIAAGPVTPWVDDAETR
jgi:hypothetical protein